MDAPEAPAWVLGIEAQQESAQLGLRERQPSLHTIDDELGPDHLAGGDQPERRRKQLVRRLEQLGYSAELLADGLTVRTR